MNLALFDIDTTAMEALSRPSFYQRIPFPGAGNQSWGSQRLLIGERVDHLGVRSLVYQSRNAHFLPIGWYDSPAACGKQ